MTALLTYHTIVHTINVFGNHSLYTLNIHKDSVAEFFALLYFQFDFGFVDIIRAKAFKLRVPSNSSPPQTLEGNCHTSASFHRLNDSNDKTIPTDVSCWNCDGELITEPNIDVRYGNHCNGYPIDLKLYRNQWIFFNFK